MIKKNLPMKIVICTLKSVNFSEVHMYVALIRFRMLQNTCIEIRQLLVHLHYLCGLSASLRAKVLQIHPSPRYA